MNFFGVEWVKCEHYSEPRSQEQERLAHVTRLRDLWRAAMVAAEPVRLEFFCGFSLIFALQAHFTYFAHFAHFAIFAIFALFALFALFSVRLNQACLHLRSPNFHTPSPNPPCLPKPNPCYICLNLIIFDFTIQSLIIQEIMVPKTQNPRQNQTTRNTVPGTRNRALTNQVAREAPGVQSRQEMV